MELTNKTIIGIAIAITVIGTGAIYFYSLVNKPTRTVTVDIIGNGKVSLGTLGAYTTVIQVDEGQSILIMAQPDQGWEFSQWGGDMSGTLNPVSIVVTKDLRIIAVFTK